MPSRSGSSQIWYRWHGATSEAFISLCCTPVPPEAGARRDAILVDHAQGAESHELRIVVIGEGEGVVRVQPPVIEVPALLGLANVNHADLLPCETTAHSVLQQRHVHARRAASAQTEGTDGEALLHLLPVRGAEGRVPAERSHLRHVRGERERGTNDFGRVAVI